MASASHLAGEVHRLRAGCQGRGGVGQVEFGVLGPLLIRRDGRVLEVGAPKQRVLLTHLLLRVGETVPVDRLIDGLWGEQPPAQARVTLRSYVSHLRRTLEGPDGQAVIVTRGNGYGLQIDPESVDAVRFDRLVAAARQDLAAGAVQAALTTLDEALGLWRGEALADVEDSDLARGERTRLEELRLSAQEERFDALLALGRHGEAVAGLEAFTATRPFRERALAQLMLGLYRSGRAPDALSAFQRFRATLNEELGLDPGPQLQDLVERILRQASDLELPAGAPADPPAAAADDRPAGAPRDAPGAAPNRLVGRAHELAELRALLDRLLAGEGALLLVAGESGIGKTALLGELGRLATAEGLCVVSGRCHETAGAPPFWPWLQVLRDIAVGLSDEELRRLTAGTARPVVQLIRDVAERLGEQPPVPAEDLEAARFQLYDAIATFLLRASEERPLVVLLDDLHWGDTPSLQTLAFLTPLLGLGSLLVAGSYRDVRADWKAELEATLAAVVREPVTQQLGLAGLQPTAVAQLAQRLRGEPLSSAELEVLHQRTRGNPFFVRQLSQLLHEAAGDDSGVGVPTGVRHVIARRLSALPGEARGLLEAGSVLGAEFNLRSLAAAAGKATGEVLAAIGHATTHGLLEPVGRPVAGYRFVHALVRETIYDSLSPHAVASWHARVAEALERASQPAVAELAEHFWQAAHLVDDDRPVRYLTAAADEALQVLAYEQAERCLRRALGILISRGNDPAAELRVRVRLARLLTGLYGWADEAVKEVANPSVALARASGFSPDVVSLWMAVVLNCIARGQLQTADELAYELLAGAQGGVPPDPAALAAGHAAVAYTDLLLGRDPAPALEHARQAQRHAATAPPEHLEGAAHHLRVTALNMEASALAHLGERAAAMAAAHRAIALAGEVAGPLPQAIAWLTGGFVAALVDEPAFTVEATDAGLALCERHGLSLTGYMHTTLNAWARAQLGENPAAQSARMWDAVESIRRFGHLYPMARCLLLTAETHLLAGDEDAARRCLEEARTLSSRTGEFLQPQRIERLEAGLTAPVGRQP